MKSILKNLSTVLFFLSFTLYAQNNDLEYFYSQVDSNMALIKANELSQNTEAFRIIDARSLKEHQISKIKGAELINPNHPNIGSVQNWDQNQTVVIYSTVGNRAQMLYDLILSKGFDNVKVLEGGVIEWLNQENDLYSNRGGISYQLSVRDKNHEKLVRNKKILCVND